MRNTFARGLPHPWPCGSPRQPFGGRTVSFCGCSASAAPRRTPRRPLGGPLGGLSADPRAPPT
eukprot:10865198-Alexandrium_andersonii.AAC.1